MSATLEIQDLTMRFGGLTAVSKFSYSVETGKIFAIIGPNGAGKTTVFNAVTGTYDPTEGSIRFEGHDLSRPVTWKTILLVSLVALFTGIFSVLAAANIDKLWRATIKRNYRGLDQPFPWSDARSDFWGYLRGDLALEQKRNGWWEVQSFDGKALGAKKERADAERLLASFEQMMSLDENAIQRSGDTWTLAGQEFETRDAAVERLRQMADLKAKRRAHTILSWFALFLGLSLGGAGTFVVWRRARRTPDVIALGGIARTFQNIRLFQNMTVLENLLVAMNRYFRVDPVQLTLTTPPARREEREAVATAMQILQFVGLEKSAHFLAKNLPYGHQRRLEIARALSTRPRLMLLDEPAAGMNPTETVELMDLIRQIRDRGITVLLIEHHMRLVMGISDRIAVLDHGVKIAEGTPEEIRNDPKVIEAYLGKEEVH